MRTFVSRLGTPSRSRKALKEFAAKGVDIRPMRWTNFQSTEILCPYPGGEEHDCYQPFAIHETTQSQYEPYSVYELCWKEGRIRSVKRVDSGVRGN
ncbi:MAG: hypothetical protein HOW73_50530 [Polyangiaceae bacterium]|nr:hypothetical protein [Polyangiaceae bacterium]